MDGKVNIFPIRVYYEDTDAGGVVYHGSYVEYAERARTEWLRAIGFSQKQLHDNHNELFVVRNLNIDYLAPLYLDDFLLVSTEIAKLGKASLTLNQNIYRINQQNNYHISDFYRNQFISKDFLNSHTNITSQMKVSLVFVSTSHDGGFKTTPIKNEVIEAIKNS